MDFAFSTVEQSLNCLDVITSLHRCQENSIYRIYDKLHFSKVVFKPLTENILLADKHLCKSFSFLRDAHRDYRQPDIMTLIPSQACESVELSGLLPSSRAFATSLSNSASIASSISFVYLEGFLVAIS